MALPFPAQPIPPSQRLWLTASYETDDFEESLAKILIGVERPGRYLWQVPVPEAEPDVIATLSPRLADMVTDQRRRRSA